MTTATELTSVRGRLQTIVLAGTLALGTLFPVATTVVADAGDPVSTTSSDSPGVVGTGFDISVETPGDLVGLTALVSSDGDGANLRAEPSLNADILASVPDGTIVDLRVDEVDTVYDADGVTRWWPVAVDGTDGWISGEFLADAAASDGTDASSGLPVDSASTETGPDSDDVSSAGIPGDGVPAFEYDGEATANSTARVAGSGENVNVRAEPSASSDVVARALDGEVIALRIADTDTVLDANGVTRWWPVVVEGQDGWISGFYLVASDDDVPTSSSATTPAPGEQTTAAFTAGDQAVATTESGTGVNIRASGTPEAAEVGFVPEGATVEIVSGPVGFDGSTNGWYEITYDGGNGFVDGDLLVLSTASEPAPSATPTATSRSTATATATARATRTPTATATATARATRTPTATVTTAAEGTNGRNSEVGQGRDGVPGLRFPLDNYTRTQGFGCSNLSFYTYDPEFGCAIHDGLDLSAPANTPIMAAAPGTVVQAGWCNCGLGYYVEIDNGNDVHTVYGHMASQPYVSIGQKVEAGEVIGPVGSTGVSTGPHVHFMVRINGKAVDPETYLP